MYGLVGQVAECAVLAAEGRSRDVDSGLSLLLWLLFGECGVLFLHKLQARRVLATG